MRNEDDSSENEATFQDSERNFVENIVDNILARHPQMQLAYNLA